MHNRVILKRPEIGKYGYARPYPAAAMQVARRRAAIDLTSASTYVGVWRYSRYAESRCLIPLNTKFAIRPSAAALETLEIDNRMRPCLFLVVLNRINRMSLLGPRGGGDRAEEMHAAASRRASPRIEISRHISHASYRFR